MKTFFAVATGVFLIAGCTKASSTSSACNDVNKAKLDFIDRCKGIAFTNSTLSGRAGGGESACRCIVNAFTVENKADKNCEISNADVISFTRNEKVKVECGSP